MNFMSRYFVQLIKISGGKNDLKLPPEILMEIFRWYFVQATQFSKAKNE
jgi:hypothetical protein